MVKYLKMLLLDKFSNSLLGRIHPTHLLGVKYYDPKCDVIMIVRYVPCGMRTRGVNLMMTRVSRRERELGRENSGS